MADYLTLQDLYKKIGSQKVSQFLIDDESTAILQPTDPNVVDVLDSAEAEAASRMLRHYSSRAAITVYAQTDAAFRGHVAWVAIQFASERRPEFSGSDGAGAFQTQYDRAIEYFDKVSKGALRGLGEAGTDAIPGAGVGANTGGEISPKPPAATSTAFTFAPNKQSGTGHGGF